MLRHSQWLKAYKAFRPLNISRAEFYRTQFDRFCEGSPKPALGTLCHAFQRIRSELHEDESAGKTPAVRGTVRSIGKGIQIAGIPSCTPRRDPHEASSGQKVSSGPVPFRLTLPDGSRIEFETAAPERVAMQMLLLSRNLS